MDYPALRSIPIVEGIDFSVLKQAEQIRKQKEQQAQALLAGIDAYLLAELDITVPQQNNSLDNRIFRVPFSEIAGNRLDPDYSQTAYKNLRDAIRRSRFKVVLLKEITNGVFSGKTPASGDYADEITPYPIIKVKSYSQESIDLSKTDYIYLPQVHRAQKGDIFILSAAHQPEYVGRHIKYLNEEPSISTSFVGELICIRANQQCESMYLFSLLSLDIFKTLINREKTGQTSHVYGKNLKFLEIPLPPSEKQKEIVNHIMDIRAQAKQLQTEAAQILADAKAEVERMILGK